MNIPHVRPAMAGFLSLGLAGTVMAGGAADAWVTIDSIDVEPGTTAIVGVTIEVDDLIGSFGFDMDADGLTITDIAYDGPLFSLGWDGWDTAPSETPNISAACIFPEDQVTGLQQLFSLEIDIPAETPVGTSFDVTMLNADVTNYAFQQFDVHVVGGEITVVNNCPADLVHDDGMVTTADLLVLLDSWGSTKSPVDLTGDGAVTVLDLLVLLESWGACP